MPTDLEAWQSVGVALAIGLLVGAERERSKHEVGSPGIRTFALVAVLGALCASLPVSLAAVLAASVAVMLAVSYLKSYEQDAGMTSEVAALATLGLGALTATRPALAASISVAVTVLLASKRPLHRFVRETVTEQERVDALRFFVAAFIVLPLLPTRAVGPYGVLVPQRVWVLVVLITGIGWVGHVATRALGAHRGLMIAGLAGGFVSGTATTGTMAARARSGAAPRDAALAGALLASVATMVQLMVVTAVAAPAVAGRLALAAVAGGLVLLGQAWWLQRRAAQGLDVAEEKAPRPLALGPAVVLAVVITAVVLLATWMDHRYGAAGATVATAAGALADLHAAAVGVATLAHAGEIATGVAVQAIGVGLVTNTTGKLLAAWVGGGTGFARALALCFAPVAALMALCLVVVG